MKKKEQKIKQTSITVTCSYVILFCFVKRYLIWFDFFFFFFFLGIDNEKLY